VTGDGPAEWVALHTNVRLRPVEEPDLDLLARLDTEPALSEPFEWRGYRDPKERRRRWERDSYLGSEDALLIVALPDGTFTGIVSWRQLPTSGPRVTYTIGILLFPEYRGQRLGSSAQCLLADQLFSTTLANRVDATTAVDNIAEQKALESAGFQKEGILRGLGYGRGKMGDGVMYSRLRSDPHP
jgi:[ribosomal protein S5]-alanine N-acetyltransferase